MQIILITVFILPSFPKVPGPACSLFSADLLPFGFTLRWPDALNCAEVRIFVV